MFMLKFIKKKEELKKEIKLKEIERNLLSFFDTAFQMPIEKTIVWKPDEK